MAAVLNPYSPFTGFQQPSYYPSFRYGYPLQPVPNNYYAPQQKPVYPQPAPAPAQAQSQQRPVYPPQAPIQPHKSAAHPQQAPAQPQQLPAYHQQAPAQPQQLPTYHQQAPMRPQQQPSMYSQRTSIPSQQRTINSQRAPMQPQPAPIQPQPSQSSKVEYVDSGSNPIRRREPRIFREVIMLPVPEPIYRQVRHRMPTPERRVIERTIIKKANGDVVVRQQQPSKGRSQSRLESVTQRPSTRSRHVHTD